MTYRLRHWRAVKDILCFYPSWITNHLREVEPLKKYGFELLRSEVIEKFGRCACVESKEGLDLCLANVLETIGRLAREDPKEFAKKHLDKVLKEIDEFVEKTYKEYYPGEII